MLITFNILGSEKRSLYASFGIKSNLFNKVDSPNFQSSKTKVDSFSYDGLFIAIGFFKLSKNVYTFLRFNNNYVNTNDIDSKDQSQGIVKGQINLKTLIFDTYIFFGNKPASGLLLKYGLGGYSAQFILPDQKTTSKGFILHAGIGYSFPDINFLTKSIVPCYFSVDIDSTPSVFENTEYKLRFISFNIGLFYNP